MLTILTETSDQSSLDTYVKNDAPLTVLYFTAKLLKVQTV